MTDSEPVPAGVPEPPAPAAQPTAGVAEGRPGHPGNVQPAAGQKRLSVWLLVVAALLAAGAAWPFVQRFANAFPNPGLDEDMTNRIRADRNDPIAWAKDRELRLTSMSRNAALNYGFSGLCLGLALGLVAAWTSGKSAAGSLRCAVAGALLGMSGGVLGGLATAQVALRIEYPGGPDASVRSMAMHAPGWALIGLACGAAVSIGSGRRLVPLLIGGTLGGGLAAVVYEQIAALAMQLDRSDVPVPEGSANKLLSLCCLAAIVAGCMGLSNSSGRRPAADTTPVAG